MITDEGGYKERKVWDQIADQWYNFRHYPMKQVKEFAFFVAKKKPDFSSENRSIKKNVLDIGAGNCRNLLPFKDNKLFALDISKEMLKNGQKYSKKFDLGIEFVQGSASELPFKNNTFDVVLAIASLQCLYKKKEREKSMKEIYRVLKPNGYVLVSSWNRWNKRFFPKNILTSNIYVPWHRQSGSIERYYHLFTKNELKNLIENSGLDIENYIDTSLFSDNIFIIAKKSVNKKSF